MHLDIDKVSAIFERLDESLGSNPDAMKMKEAAVALHFVWGNGYLHSFEDLLACFTQSVLPEQAVSFDTRQQAITWLEQGQNKRRAACVSIAGARHSIIYSLDRGDIELLQVPTEHDLTSVGPSTGSPKDEIAVALYRALSRTHAPEEVSSILMALLALYFVTATGQVSDFESFLSDFNSRVALAPLRVFDTRQEADAWLKSHPRPPHGGRVEISGQRFSVGYNRESDFRVLVRNPSLEELGLAGSTNDPDA